jgi:hypothetical protein
LKRGKKRRKKEEGFALSTTAQNKSYFQSNNMKVTKWITLSKDKCIACFEFLKEVDEEGAAGEHSSPKRCAERPSQNSIDERSEQVC